MENIINNLSQKSVDLGVKILAGLVVLIIGFRVINFIEKKLKKRKLSKIDQSVKTFIIKSRTRMV